MSHPGTKEIPPYLIGKKKLPPLIENLGDERSNLIEESFDKDLLWAIAGDYGVNNTDETIPLLSNLSSIRIFYQNLFSSTYSVKFNLS